jgi:tetratricopeptide (TPR) repeat protein
MYIDKTNIQQRQYYFWLGRQREDEKDLSGAIEAYVIYATHLAPQDKHIPHGWISSLYEMLGDDEKAMSHLSQFAAGCSQKKAAELYKELGYRHLALNNIDDTIHFFKLALSNDLTIGVRTKLNELLNI